MKRRSFVRGALAGLMGYASNALATRRARVVVVGAGYGGTTAAKYVRVLSGHQIDVVLVDPHPAFVSCPGSNLVISGSKTLDDITRSYDSLTRLHGVQQVCDVATGIDPERKTIALANGPAIRYDKLVLSPGIELMFDTVEGLREAHVRGQILQAWKAGPETLALHQQLQAMPDGGVYAISIPQAPYRCLPAPYERACLVANYFKQHKPRSKVLVLDANQDVTFKSPAFKKFWTDHYQGILDYLPEHNVVAVDAPTGTLIFDVQNDVRADVLNVLPAMRAGSIAVQSGLATVNARWCDVHYQTFASTLARDIHVIGDSIMAAPLMPKSGQMAHAQGKITAAAIVAELSDRPINPTPFLNSVCYSFVDDKLAMHAASMHQYDAISATYQAVTTATDNSNEPSEQEATAAALWAENIWADMLR